MLTVAPALIDESLPLLHVHATVSRRGKLSARMGSYLKSAAGPCPRTEAGSYCRRQAFPRILASAAGSPSAARGPWVPNTAQICVFMEGYILTRRAKRHEGCLAAFLQDILVLGMRWVTPI